MIKVIMRDFIAVPKFTFAAISLDDLKSFIHLHEGFIGNYEWNLHL